MSRADYRLVEHRESVFLDFYEFHLKYRAHPGGVYYLIPYLRDHFGWDDEQTLWYAFLNGNTQNPITSLILHQSGDRPDQYEAVIEAWRRDYDRLEFDTDRRYHKKNFEKSVRGYMDTVWGSQMEFWSDAASGGFSHVWVQARRIPTFGRLSAFSYSEYLRIAGLDFDCDTLFLNDIDGSRSHRNGLCIVSGRDVYDWHDSNPNFPGSYPRWLIDKLNDTAHSLLDQMKARSQGKDYERDVSLFTLESALCTYKSWHRPNRRYPNVYNDMLYDRIKKNERLWADRDLGVFWEARRAALPDYLRLEDMPTDPGLAPIKQNHYRLTGQVIMMDRDYPQYQNDFNDGVRAGIYGQRP